MDQQHSRLARDEDPALLSSQPANQLWPSLSEMRASRRAREHRHQAVSERVTHTGNRDHQQEMELAFSQDPPPCFT